MSRPGLYLFFGPDRPRKLQRIQELERALKVHALDRHHVDAAAVRPADLLALCRQRPAASAVRLIVVDSAHRLDGSAVEALRQHAAAIAETACVVFLVDVELSGRHALQAAGPPFATERFVARDAPTVKPFALTEALGQRRVLDALVAVRDQLHEGREPHEVVGLVAWQVQRWVVVKRLLAAGYSGDQIAAVTGMRPWQVERIRSEIAHAPLEALQEMLTRCWQVDRDAKSGRVAPERAVEQLVLEVCLTPGDGSSG